MNASDGAVYLGSEDVLNLDTVVAGTEARIKTGDAIVNASTSGNPNVVSGDLILEAGTQSVGASGNPVTIDLYDGARLTARARNSVYLREVTGANSYGLNIDTIYATNTVEVTAEQWMYDAFDDTLLNINTKYLVLNSYGMIGAPETFTDRYLEIDTVNSEEPLITVNSGGDVYLYEILGNMRINSIDATGWPNYSHTLNFRKTGDQTVVTATPDTDFNGTILITTTQNGSGSAFEIQKLSYTATAGTYTLTYNGQTTTALAYNASASEIATALNSLSNVQSIGGIKGLGTGGDVYLKSFSNLVSKSGISVDVTGKKITLDALNGFIGSSGEDLIIDTASDASGTLTTNSYFDAYLVEAYGDLYLATVSVPAGTAFIVAPESILDGNPGNNNIESGKARLIAVVAVGQSSAYLKTELGYLEGKTTSASLSPNSDAVKAGVWLSITAH